MRELHSWKVDVQEAIRLQEDLRDNLILKKTFSEVRTIGGGDVTYSKNRNLLLGAIVVLSYPRMETFDISTAYGKIPFPYIPGLLSFREGPILIQSLRS